MVRFSGTEAVRCGSTGLPDSANQLVIGQQFYAVLIMNTHSTFITEHNEVMYYKSQGI